MSALHRLKAYFGMVPADELDDYGPDYEYRGDEHRCDDYRRDEYRRDEHRRDEHRRDEYRSGYDAGYEPPHPPRDRDRTYAADRSLAHGSGRADFDARDARRDERPGEPGGATAARMHPPRRSTWAPEAPVRGSLAVDPTASIREPSIRDPLTREPPTPARTGLFPEEEVNPLTRIVTLHPHNYSEARPIGERYREGAPVIMNLTGMDDKDAKRVVDFAAGLAFALRGSIDRVTNKVFLLSPPNVEVSAEDRRRIAEGGLFN